MCIILLSKQLCFSTIIKHQSFSTIEHQPSLATSAMGPADATTPSCGSCAGARLPLPWPGEGAIARAAAAVEAGPAVTWWRGRVC